MTREEEPAVRSPELLEQGALTPWFSLHGPSALTTTEADAFLRGRVRAWSALDEAFRARFSLLEYTGMTGEEMASWILTGTVPARVRRVWGLA